MWTDSNWCELFRVYSTWLHNYAENLICIFDAALEIRYKYRAKKKITHISPNIWIGTGERIGYADGTLAATINRGPVFYDKTKPHQIYHVDKWWSRLLLLLLFLKFFFSLLLFNVHAVFFFFSMRKRSKPHSHTYKRTPHAQTPSQHRHRKKIPRDREKEKKRHRIHSKTDILLSVQTPEYLRARYWASYFVSMLK